MFVLFGVHQQAHPVHHPQAQQQRMQHPHAQPPPVHHQQVQHRQVQQGGANRKSDYFVISIPVIFDHTYPKVSATSAITFTIAPRSPAKIYVTGLQISFRDFISGSETDKCSLLITFNNNLKFNCRLGQDLIRQKDQQYAMCETYRCVFKKPIAIQMANQNKLFLQLNTPVRCADLQYPLVHDVNDIQFDLIGQESNRFLTKIFFDMEY